MGGCGHISDRFFRLLLLMIIPMWLEGSTFSSQATTEKFHVGGKDGWVEKPSEDYDHWAERNRFQVNDTLYFKYKKGNDSVLVVKKEDYYSCNINNVIHKMNHGDSTFHLNKTGVFFFISGNVDNCKNGQKLIVFILAVRHRPCQPAPPSQSPESAPPPQQIQSSNLTLTARKNGSFEAPWLVCDWTWEWACINGSIICKRKCIFNGFPKGGHCMSFRGSDLVCCCKKI